MSFDVRPWRIELAGSPVLRERCAPVASADILRPEFQHLLESMRTSLHAARGVGLAANQVGLSRAVIVIEDAAVPPADSPPGLFDLQERLPVAYYAAINPSLEVLPDSEVATWFEGCLSVPGYVTAVPRHTHVRLTALSSTGEPLTIDAVGWHARILQHELDHLDGQLLIDRMLPRTFMRREEFLARWRHVPISEVTDSLGA